MSIPGWTDDDIRTLYDEIASTVGEGDPFVEVGVAYGSSLVYLADRDWPRGNPKLWAVDLWEEHMGGDNLPADVFARMTALGSPMDAFVAMVKDWWESTGTQMNQQGVSWPGSFNIAMPNAP
jgi:hypothetical protein